MIDYLEKDKTFKDKLFVVEDQKLKKEMLDKIDNSIMGNNVEKYTLIGQDVMTGDDRILLEYSLEKRIKPLYVNSKANQTVKITERDLSTLDDEVWLGDEAINFWTTYLQNKKQNRSAHHMTTYFFTLMNKQGVQSVIKNMMGDVLNKK